MGMGVGHFVDYVRIDSTGQPWNKDSTAMYRASLIPTTSYVAGAVIDTWKFSQMIINWGFTIGSLTSGQLKVEFSPDNTNWYQETFGAVSTTTETDSLGEHSVSATGNYRLPIKISDRYVRVSVKGTGTTTSSLVQVDITLGIN